MILFAILTLLSITTAPAVSEKSGPYISSGWKPQGARLELPESYGTPLYIQRQSQVAVNEQYPPEVTTETNYHTTTENYDYDTTTLDRGYLLPATTDGPINTQNLPDMKTVQGFRRNQNVQQNGPAPQEENAKFSEWGDFKSHFFASQYQLHIDPRNGQLRLPFGRLVQEDKLSQQQTPSTEYGAPANKQTDETETDVESVDEDTNESQTSQQNRKENEQSDDEENTQEIQNENNVPDTETTVAQFPRFMGQYYILAPDNTLQRIRYETLRTEDDVEAKGFTAQLKYAPVEPIKDPVYGYNEMGQLIRLYKK